MSALGSQNVPVIDGPIVASAPYFPPMMQAWSSNVHDALGKEDLGAGSDGFFRKFTNLIELSDAGAQGEEPVWKFEHGMMSWSKRVFEIHEYCCKHNGLGYSVRWDTIQKTVGDCERGHDQDPC